MSACVGGSESKCPLFENPLNWNFMPVRTSTTLKFFPVGITFLADDQSSNSTVFVPVPSKSDLIYPFEPLTLTLDHPFD